MPDNILSPALTVKLARLQAIICDMKRLVVAYSGGVDSSLVAKAALDMLGAENVLAVIAISSSLGADEERQALAVLKEIGIPFLTVPTKEVEDPRYASNPVNRCYFCKEHVYDALVDVCKRQHFDVVVDGFNLDDAGDHRPGIALSPWSCWPSPS